MNAEPYDTGSAARAASMAGQTGRDAQMCNLTDLARAPGPVQPGAYDQQVVQWLALQPPAAVAVVCGWLTRARTGGLA